MGTGDRVYKTFIINNIIELQDSFSIQGTIDNNYFTISIIKNSKNIEILENILGLKYKFIKIKDANINITIVFTAWDKETGYPDEFTGFLDKNGNIKFMRTLYSF